MSRTRIAATTFRTTALRAVAIIAVSAFAGACSSSSDDGAAKGTATTTRSSAGSGNGQAFCNLLRQLQKEDGLSISPGSGTNSSGAVSSATAIQRMLDNYTSLVDTAPPEMKADMQSLAAFVTTAIAAGRNGPAGSIPATTLDPAEIGKYRQASQHLAAYATSTCGVTSGSTTTTTG